ncbi:EthD family reductase [Mastigocladopsis repens]|uniref:EthD family reductase n=1 Tax=Mastigocladopsis repens TaxID=221287 RepID=UPI0003793FFD|nr:EthD family reductase [Mastigocladopsis repens]
MTTLLVTYAGDASTRFDRDYFVGIHLPLVLEAWGPYGLKTIDAFFPAGDGAGIIAIAVCVFQDEAALSASLSSPQTNRVMADVEHYTDAKPRRTALS